MRARAGAAVLGLLVIAGCRGDGAPPVVEASEVRTTQPASPTADPAQARLAELRATDQFDEFADHERAAKADGARLAWENFAPIVDGERVEWTNKAELWDRIAPRIRDEALLLGPEYGKPLWDNRNAIPNVLAMTWNDADTEGRGHFAEFGATYLGADGPAETYWGVLIARDADGVGTVLRVARITTVPERDYASSDAALNHRRDAAWQWIFEEGPA